MVETPTVTIQLPTSLYNDLQDLAAEDQIDPVEVIARLVAIAEKQRVPPKPPTQAFRQILERATDLGVSNLAEEHDRYLYSVDES